jgi:hypothetical protein
MRNEEWEFFFIKNQGCGIGGGEIGLCTMEIKCPKCSNSFECRETWDLSICPYCSASLEVAHAESGFMLVGVNEDAGPYRTTMPAAAVEDPVTEDYSRWRTRAVFCMLFGAVLAVITAMGIAHGILGYGAFFFKSLKNQLFIAILALASACCIGGGAWLYRYLGKEREKYLRREVSGARQEGKESIRV